MKCVHFENSKFFMKLSFFGQTYDKHMIHMTKHMKHVTLVAKHMLGHMTHMTEV